MTANVPISEEIVKLEDLALALIKGERPVHRFVMIGERIFDCSKRYDQGVVRTRLEKIGRRVKRHLAIAKERKRLEGIEIARARSRLEAKA